MPSPPRCLLDVSHCRVATCKTLWKNKSINTCLDYFSFPSFYFSLLLALPSPFVGAAICDSAYARNIFFPLCLSQRSDAKQWRLASQCLRFLWPPFTVANWALQYVGKSADQNNIKIRPDRDEKSRTKSCSCLYTQIFDWWSWAAFAFCSLLESLLNYLYFSNFYPICWHTIYILCCSWCLNQVRVFQFPDIHLWEGENRAVTCQGGAQCPMWAPVSVKVKVPPAASLWDYPRSHGHAKASWELSKSRDVNYHLQPLHVCSDMHPVKKNKINLSYSNILSICFSQLLGPEQVLGISWE